MLTKFKVVFLVAFISLLVGCGTVGGAVSGAGTDLQKAGEWIRNR